MVHLFFHAANLLISAVETMLSFEKEGIRRKSLRFSQVGDLKEV